MRLVLAMLVAWSVSCAGQQDRAGEPEGRSALVGAVILEGAEAIDRDDLVEGLANHPPRGFIVHERAEYDPLALELDKKRLERFYLARGFFSFRLVRTEVDPIEDDGVAIRFVVEEGPRSTWSGVQIEGALPEGLDRDRILQIQIGTPFDHQAYLDAKERLEAHLVTRGYAHASVEGTISVDRATHRVEALFNVDPGPLTRFGKLEVQGLEEVPESLIRNRVAWSEGEVFDPLLLETTRGRVYETGLVSGLRFDWEGRDHPEVLNLVAAASEGEKNEIRLGGGVGVESAHYELRLRAGYVRKSFLDPLMTLRLNVRPAYAFFRNLPGNGAFNVDAGAEIDREDFLIPRLKLTTGARYSLTQLETYQTQGPTLSVGVGRPLLHDRLTLATSVHYAFFDVALREDVTAAQLDPFGYADPLSLVYLEPNLVYEGRDDPLNPHEGWYLRLQAEAGSLLSGDRGSYLTVTPELRGYLPLGPQITVAARARLGSKVAGSEPLPLTQRMFGGGADSQRGFGKRRLSPSIRRSSDGALVPVGGEASVETSAELRIDLFKLFDMWLGVVGFVDGADVQQKMREIDLAELHWASGGGLRYRTPIGPIRLDVGFRLNRKGPSDPDPDSAWAIHFSLGEAF